MRLYYALLESNCNKAFRYCGGNKVICDANKTDKEGNYLFFEENYFNSGRTMAINNSDVGYTDWEPIINE